MKYMLLIYGSEDCWTAEEREACMIESMGLCEQLAAEGKYVASGPLHSVTTATSVRVREGKKLITDGPFAETTEQLGGYYIIDVENLDEAIAIAARIPPAKKGTVEIRPLVDVTDLAEGTDCDIITTRVLPFSREQVFAAFSDPERLARWWGPAGFTNTFHEFDFRPGGTWRFVMHGPDGINYDNLMQFRVVKEPEQVVVEHLSEPRFVATYTFTATTDETTRLHWRMRFESPQMRDRLLGKCGPANEENLDRLTAELKRVAGESEDAPATSSQSVTAKVTPSVSA